jgi:hypothetical protein
MRKSNMVSRADSIDGLLDDHPSLVGSLEDFEADRSVHFGNASAHSASRSEHSEAESDRSSAPWSPPAWHQQTGGTWYQRARTTSATAGSRLLAHSKSRSPTNGSLYDEDNDTTVLPYAVNVPLPPSPEKDDTPASNPSGSPEIDAARSGAEEDVQDVHHEDDNDATPKPEGGNCKYHELQSSH